MDASASRNSTRSYVGAKEDSTRSYVGAKEDNVELVYVGAIQTWDELLYFGAIPCSAEKGSDLAIVFKEGQMQDLFRK
jgi:hypothetical protein